MQIITKPITLSEIKKMADNKFGNLIKAVVDIEKKIMVVDASLHADEEVLLLENGSKQQYLWGINIYPDLPKDQRIEFDSMINLRPSGGNRSRGVDDPIVRQQIITIVSSLLIE